MKKITVEATDGQGTQQLSAVYSGIKFHFYLDGESSNFEPDTIDIKREDVEHGKEVLYLAALQEGAILMYQTKKSRTWCKKVDKVFCLVIEFVRRHERSGGDYRSNLIFHEGSFW